mmetsp:Transcript_50040/g.95573  ORF Transcript_50040/g.95573 Transcript_50040/m.95573 type:complete len:243 (+) Transcript_50040:635-1363(+)
MEVIPLFKLAPRLVGAICTQPHLALCYLTVPAGNRGSIFHFPAHLCPFAVLIHIYNRFVKRYHLLLLCLHLAVELREAQYAGAQLDLVVQVGHAAARVESELLEPRVLGVAEAVHAPLERLVVARHDVLLVTQQPVALLPLPAVRGDLRAPVSERVLQADELAHPALDDARRGGVVLGQLAERLRARVGGRLVRLVLLVKVRLQVRDGALQRNLEHVVLLAVLVLVLLALRLVLLPRVVLCL